MCHAIEDPTFDATAVATNPRAQVRPLHRPPRVPAGREPHCHWTITIDPVLRRRSRRTRISRSSSSRRSPADRRVDEPRAGAAPSPAVGTTTRATSIPTSSSKTSRTAALVIALQEVAVQSHLLLRAFAVSVAQHYGEDTALELLPQIFTGLAGMTAQRLVAGARDRDTRRRRNRAAAAPAPDVLAAHLRRPAGRGASTTSASASRSGRARCSRRPTASPGSRSSAAPAIAALDAIVQAVDPRAACHPVATRGDERFAYEAVIDPDAKPASRGARDRAGEDQRRRHVRVHPSPSGARGLTRRARARAGSHRPTRPRATPRRRR